MTLLPLNEEILPPSDDYIFKAMLTNANAKPVLMDLISAVIGQKVVDVELRNNELPITDVEEKNERLDVNCVIDDGSMVDVEMQGSKIEEIDESNSNVINKSLYYATDLYSSQPSKGVKFYDLKRAYQITFCTYTVFPDRDKYITYGNMRDEDGKLITDQLNMITVELNKLGQALSKPVEDMSELDMWSAFLGYANDPNKRGLINQIIEHREEIAMAGQLIMDISKNPDEQARYRSRHKAEFIRTSNLLTAEERGKREGIKVGEARGIEIGETRGIEIGVAQTLRNMAKTMKADGMPVDKIVKLTNLTADEINML